MSEKEESEGSNLDPLTSTPGSSPFQQVPVNELLQPLPRTSYNSLMHTNAGTPCLRILVEPQEHFRFRYKSETDDGGHGYLQGDTFLVPDGCKIPPTVELINYEDVAVIKCQVYQHDKDLEHPHKVFYGRIGVDPVVEVSKEKGYTVPFECLGVVKTMQNELLGQLNEQLQNTENYESLDKKTLRQYRKRIDLNRFRLRFSAHDPTTDKELCSVFSRTVCNKSSAKTNELKICRISHTGGKMRGGEYVMLFVERITKGIKVFFFEENSEGENVWRAEANVVEMHHQYGICIRTPAYTNKPEEELSGPVDVWMELQRTTDGRRSEPRAFRYVPEPHHLLRKRARKCTATSTDWRQETSASLPQVIAFATPPMEALLPMDGAGAYNEPITLPDSAGDHDKLFELLNPEEMSVEQLSGPFNQAPNDLQEFKEFLLNDFDALVEQHPFILLDEEQHLPSQPTSDLRSQPTSGYDFVSDQPHPSKEWKPFSLCSLEVVREEAELADYGALRVADILEIQTLIKDILDLKKRKLLEWYKEVIAKLETLYEMRMSNGETVLHVLLHNNEAGFRRIVELTNKLGRADLLNAQSSHDGLTVLHIAVATDQAELVSFLLQQGCDPLVGDWSGDSALHVAAARGGGALRPLLAAMLERCGRDPSKMDRMLRLPNYEFQSPLWLAVDRQCLESIQLLVEHYSAARGLDAECRGRSPLQLAVEHDRPDIVNILLDVTPKGAACLTGSLQSARAMLPREHTAEIITMLLDHGADPVCIDDIHLEQSTSDSECSDEDDFHSADDWDSDDSEDITTKLQAVNINNRN